MTLVIARPALLTYNFSLHLIYCKLHQRMKVSLMLARPRNTVAKRNILIDLMELLLQEMDRENEGDANNLDDYLMGFSTNRMTYDMDVRTLPYSSCLW
jgi:hypothetical protein